MKQMNGQHLLDNFIDMTCLSYGYQQLCEQILSPIRVLMFGQWIVFEMRVRYYFTRLLLVMLLQWFCGDFCDACDATYRLSLVSSHDEDCVTCINVCFIHAIGIHIISASCLHHNKGSCNRGNDFIIQFHTSSSHAGPSLLLMSYRLH